MPGASPDDGGSGPRHSGATGRAGPIRRNETSLRILIVEDSEDLADAMASRLRASGHAVDRVADGEAATELVAGESYEIVILDIGLPKRDGFAVLADIRRRRLPTRVLVVTARAEIDDKVGLLDLGADDYLVKPFDLRELEARLRALVRRPGPLKTSASTFANLSFDAASRQVAVDGRDVELGRREFRLLEILVSRLGQTVPKEYLLDQLFGLDEPVSPNAIELYVSRLRRKIEGARLEIVTVRGFGYMARCDDAG